MGRHRPGGPRRRSRLEGLLRLQAHLRRHPAPPPRPLRPRHRSVLVSDAGRCASGCRGDERRRLRQVQARQASSTSKRSSGPSPRRRRGARQDPLATVTLTPGRLRDPGKRTDAAGCSHGSSAALSSASVGRKQRILGSEFAGEVEAAGADVQEFARSVIPCSGRAGVRFRAHAEYICLPQGDRIGAQARGRELRGGRCIVRWRTEFAVVPAAGRRPEGADGPRLRCVRAIGTTGGAAGQVFRRRRHGGVQHQEHRTGAIARGRSRDRLTHRRTTPGMARRTRSSSMPSARTHSGTAKAR